MIPKVIHYCWFGGKPKSRLMKKCMKSWKKYAPDFEIREWNESNFDFSNSKYAYEAFREKKWAFVSDYVRFVVLKQYGGIYLDTDVELLRPLDAELLRHDFAGFETAKSVASGLMMGTHSNGAICEKMLASYEEDSFVLHDGTFNLRTVCQRMTDLLVQDGLELEDRNQIVGELWVYESKYFNPLGLDGKGKVTPMAYSVHHYNASWYTPKEKLIKVIGPKNTKRIVKLLHSIKGK